MLEILGIFYLCNANKKNALARGCKPGLYIGLTIGFWLGFEFLSIFVGAFNGLETTALYPLAIFSALLGGLISYILAKNCPKGTYVEPMDQMTLNSNRTAEKLIVPATLEIVCKKFFLGSRLGYPVTLNGQNIGALSSGKLITVNTNQKQNILCASDAYGQKSKPFLFTVENASRAQISFKPGKFLLESVSGGIPAAQVNIQQSLQSNPAAPSISYCRSCGAKVLMGGDCCTSCGASL